MAGNRSLVYTAPKQVSIQNLDFPKLALGKRKCDHGAILRVVVTNICGSDQHIYRGRFTVPSGIEY